MTEKKREDFYGSEKKTSEGDDSGDVVLNDGLSLPEVNFSTFIFSMNSSALVQLGMLPDPVTGKESIDLALAKHTIDTISMLKRKTEGNLNEKETEMIMNILYDLKILYVKFQK